jgi:putative ABC transport system permease protein
MRVPLAWRNISHEKSRSAVGIAGMTFAIVLIFLQLGFYGAIIIGSTQVYDQLEGDLVIVSREYSFIHSPRSFPKARLQQALGARDVLTVRPLYIGATTWRNPATGLKNSVILIAFDPRRPVFSTPSINAHLTELCHSDTVLVDSDTREKYGPRSAGDTIELAGRRVHIADQYRLGTSFVELAMIVLSDQNFVRVLHGSLNDVAVGVIRLRTGADPAVAARELRSRLPADIEVWTREQFRAHEVRHVLLLTSTGMIFGSGVIVAVIVGMVILYQTISTQIVSKLSEYATLKAIGYTPLEIVRIVLGQALLLSVIAFLPGLGLGLLLYDGVQKSAFLPMVMPAGRIVGVLLLVVAMSIASGLLAYRKVHVANPADLF